ncbi:ABC transporter substrate-binding protein [Streptomyces sp. NRRL B-1677]|uniref:ABC transporter substrate-binding protein n=1 Tax=Streptomyces klenkii TaxID=1420899 RepID=A0A3B0AY60_9ACTN|nr:MULTISPECIES: ABC transporter substrate-binding protein [Streptomyces]MBF6050075.1 ABC transporter substrate-binding protein [Streptomyces sp. NRRL B-1677]RKN64966.1 ABC transporter substrate-binding protein [Streptomyces klenkii]
MRPRAWCGVLAAVALSATACGSGGGGGAAEKSDDAGSGARSGFPVTVTDCMGAKTTFDAAPKKIVTSNAAGLELLMWLGAADKAAGTGFPPGKGAMPGQYADRAAKVPALGKTVIPKEKLLGSGADLYVDAFSSMKNMGKMGDAPTAEEFKAAGIKHVFLKSTACASMSKSPRTDLSGVEADIEELGKVTGTSARAAELVQDMRKKTGAVRDALKDVPAGKRPSYFFFDYDAGTKQPMAVCNRQVANAVISMAGGRNVFDGCDGDFKPVGWEDVVAKNPDWIQLGVRNRGSDEANAKAFDEAAEFLKTFPATKDLTAVKEGRFLRIGSERTTIGGVRSADTVREIAHTLHPDRVK